MIRIPVAALALSFAAAIAPAAWGQSTGTTSASEPKSAPGAPLKGLDVAAEPRQLRIATKAWTGDFDKMLERRMIRIYAPFSRSLYYNDKGRERGIAVELARDWERYLNVKYAKQLGKRPLTVYIAPATRDKLLPYLDEGPGGRLDRQPHGHRRAAEARRFRPGRRGPAHDQRGGRHRPREPGARRRSTTSPARRCTCARRRRTTRASWR